MSSPLPNLKVTFKNRGYNLSYTNNDKEINEFTNPLTEITNYEYETNLNEQKRNILILKPEYVSVFISELRNIMSYDKSSQYEDKKTKRGYNPNLK